MSVVALSPMELHSPMITSITPTSDPPTHPSDPPATQLEAPEGHNSHPEARHTSHRRGRAPPLHPGADWKVVLHLPEIQTWLRATADRVTQLTHSVSVDTESRHVDVHLVQLKDICEDISDHVEQVHALLETEFSLKLLSYSVNIIVDIRTVQLLWHQLRVSVLVLKERLLQGLQDSNGNYSRQTDILQAFSQEQQQTRLDALTEVDDSGQLTIRCSQDYFSLDCGITAFELSDYSPGEEPEGRGVRAEGPEAPGDPGDPGPGRGPEPQQRPEEDGRKSPEFSNSNQELPTELTRPADREAGQSDQEATPTNPPNPALGPSTVPTMHCGIVSQCEAPKRPHQAGGFGCVLSPTQPSLPKRPALRSDGEMGGAGDRAGPPTELRLQAEPLLDPMDRSRFWLELDSRSCQNPQVTDRLDIQTSPLSSQEEGEPEGSVRGQRPGGGQMEESGPGTRSHSEAESDSSLPSTRRGALLSSSDVEASGEESDPRPSPAKQAVRMVQRPGQKTSPHRAHWYGSEEFLALPAQLRKTEMLALKLESLAQTLPLRSTGYELSCEVVQNVDDWDLTELNPDWDDAAPSGESGDDAASPTSHLLQRRQNHFLFGRFSPASSSDFASSLDESIESGRLSELHSEAEEGRSSSDPGAGPTPPARRAPPVDVRGTTPLVSKLLDNIQQKDKDSDIWKKMEGFVSRLDVFITWLKEALDSTDCWTKPRAELDNMKVYLDTHLSFKLNVDSRCALKERIMEEGRTLLTVLPSHNTGLGDILQMVSSQWEQLQLQIRRQHSWMLAALLALLHQSHASLLGSQGPSPNRQAPRPADRPEAELTDDHEHQHTDDLQQMAAKLHSLQYQPPSSRRLCKQPATSSSLQEFEADYQELSDWLMDMEALVTDGHKLTTSEEQRRHLHKGVGVELSLMHSRKSSLLGWAESLRRSSTLLPRHFDQNVHALSHRWRQLEDAVREPGPSGGARGSRGGAVDALPGSSLSPLTQSLLDQLEVRIKELKSWLRDTELLIFNSCLRAEQEASAQLPSFRSLCEEVQRRRRGVSSVLRLCHKLLQQSQVGPTAEMGPEAEQHREALQLLSINLERRWEAIVMQGLQWQNRLKRELGEEQVPGNFLEPELADLHRTSPVLSGPTGPDDFWEWDDTDMTITESEPQPVAGPALTERSLTALDPGRDKNRGPPGGIQTDRARRTDSPADQADRSDRTASGSPQLTSGERNLTVQSGRPIATTRGTPPDNSRVYQVYSLHEVELYRQPEFPVQRSPLKTNTGNRKQPLLKSLSKDSTFSSFESLPDLLEGVGGGRAEGRTAACRHGGSAGSSRRSESESGIVSDTGDTEAATNSENQGEEEECEGGGGRESRKKRGRDTEERSCPDVSLRRRTDREAQGAETREGKRGRDGGEKGGDREENASESRRRRDDEDGESRGKRDEGTGEIRRRRDKTNVEKRRRQRRGGEAMEMFFHGRGIPTPADSDSDLEGGGRAPDAPKTFDDITGLTGLTGLRRPTVMETLSRQPSTSALSQGSSLESLLAPGLELFPSSKDPLHRSTSLESCLAPCRSSSCSLASLGEMGLGELGLEELCLGELGLGDLEISEPASKDPSSGELSRRTLELLKRLENIQSSPAGRMTRSASDMTLRSSSPQLGRLRSSPSLGGRHAPPWGGDNPFRKGPPSLLSQSSAGASLVELSSAEDSSLGSEVCAAATERRLLLETGANANCCLYGRRCHGNSRRGQGPDEADGASLSMVVNVSCTSACTDDEGDDGDLLSSSTLTLTEEELGIRDEGEEGTEGKGGVASSEEDDDGGNDEEEMEGCDVLAFEELRSWIRSPRASRGESGLQDELQCGSSLTSSCTSTPSTSSLLAPAVRGEPEEVEGEEEEEAQKRRRSAARTYSRQLVEDVENGNAERRAGDEDELLLREEAGLFRGDAFRFQPPRFAGGRRPGDQNAPKTAPLSPSASSERASSLVGQLRGELPCHSPAPLPSSPSLSPLEDCGPRGTPRGRKSITIQENFAFSSLVSEQSRREVRDRASSLAPRKRHAFHPSCCRSAASLPPFGGAEGKRDNVRDFVMEIIDMTNLALRGKRDQNQKQACAEGLLRGSGAEQGPATQIREKVLEHSHQAIRLRKGDFYSYLSLSSHDSDCGEVGQCPEDQSATPSSVPCYATPTPSPQPIAARPGTDAGEAGPGPETLGPPRSPDIRDEEPLFPACTEEVYLGPPLCYSMELPRKAPSSGPGADRDPAYLSFPDPPPGSDPALARSFPAESGSPPGRSPRGAPYGPPDLHGDAPLPSPRTRTRISIAPPAPGGGGGAGAATERSGNVGFAYLNPPTRVGAIRRSADSEKLESNMAAIMTEISVCRSATNPSKEASESTTRANPKINRSAMGERDRGEDEGSRTGGREEEASRARRRGGRRGSEPEAKAKQTLSGSLTSRLQL